MIEVSRKGFLGVVVGAVVAPFLPVVWSGEESEGHLAVMPGKVEIQRWNGEGWSTLDTGTARSVRVYSGDTASDGRAMWRVPLNDDDD